MKHANAQARFDRMLNVAQRDTFDLQQPLESKLTSLKDILLKDVHASEQMNQVETYKMLNKKASGIEGDESNGDQTIVVKRMDLIFNEKECQVFNFTDMTMYLQLKREEDKNKFLNALNMSVHHEMLAPLKTNVEASSHLIRSLIRQNASITSRKMA